MVLKRVQLDLSEFINDHRKYSFVLLRKEWKQISCICNYVQEVFNLPAIDLLTENLVYLPRVEPINIINPEEVLKVIEECKSTSKIIKNKEEQKPLSKCQYNGSSVNNTDEIEDIESELDINVLDTNKTNKKRKRRRKCKNPNIDQNIIKIKNHKQSPTKSLSNIENYPKRHFHFNDDGEIEENESIVLKDTLEDLDNTKARTFKALVLKVGEIKQTAATEKITEQIVEETFETTAKEHNEIKPSGNIEISLDSEMCNAENENEQILKSKERFNTDDTSTEISQEKVSEEDCSKLSYSIEQLVSISKLITECPKKGDIIMFKIKICFDEKSEPVLSNYINGKIESITGPMNMLKIFIIDGRDHLQNLSPNMLNNDIYLNIEFKDLYNARLL